MIQQPAERLATRDIHEQHQPKISTSQKGTTILPNIEEWSLMMKHKP